MHVYGVMITGKDGRRRRRWALASAYNFAAQRYTLGPLTLVVVNHGETPLFGGGTRSWVEGTHAFPDGRTVHYLEAFVRKERSSGTGTLGDLRNLALSRVPPGAVFVTWDDDDYRATSFLRVMEDRRRRDAADAVMLGRRVECSLVTDAAWVSTIRGGAINTLYAVRNAAPWQRYESVDVFEDDPLKRALHARARVSIVDDAPAWTYVRFHHGSNTSPFAASRALPGWRPLSGDPIEEEFVRRARAAYAALRDPDPGPDS